MTIRDNITFTYSKLSMIVHKNRYIIVIKFSKKKLTKYNQ